MNVGERPEQLVDVELDFEDRHRGLHLVEVSRSAVDRLRDVFKDEVQVDVVFLMAQHDLAQSRNRRRQASRPTHPFAI